jgi:acyl-CoA dehydrogenase
MIELDDELKEVQQAVRDFARKEIKPIALELDQKPKDYFHWPIVQKGGQMGLLTDMIPERYGGSLSRATRRMLRAAIVTEEMSAACSGIGIIFGAHALGLSPILASLNPALWDRFFPEITAAAMTEKPKLCAFAITEPDAGSDVEDTQGSRHARLMTYARREGDYYILNGRKCFISNGSVAWLVTVFATLDKDAGVDAWTCFAVTRDMPGFSVGRIEDKMGQRACHAAELIFEDVRVPRENRVSREGQGWAMNQAILDLSRTFVGSASVGIARNAYEIALNYATERIQGGKRLIDHQAIQMMLADMATRIEAARALIWQTCRMLEKRIPAPKKEPAMCKMFASDIAVEVCLDAIQILGGYGYMRDYGVEKCLRDAKLTQIYEGTNQIQRLRIIEGIKEEMGIEARK